ncbi:MBL fold metallo-hydrolase [Methylocaldum sp.]|uniref:MBL fold metallo-hydrolase n=1 Tax=Methylocaldum sp. TaxID=1969727 RepID=UPI002D728572|nr:MBL fold metallo-hydrolase [Methylocaldum sp.]HYE35110.1 MBL fold metallo-hydrolase [Methylocaldum sp.]
MKVTVIPVTPFQQNCSLLWCEDTMEGVVVDPGGDLDRILKAAEDARVKLVKILLTHAHVDHAGGTAVLAARLGIPIEGPQKEDRFWIELLPKQCEMFGFPPAAIFTPDRWLEDGDTVRFGHQTLEVLHCPGHTPGHVVFFHAGERLAIVGDVLFKGSIGRTDFPRGDYDDLVKSIRERLFPLGDDVAFIPGHGPLSTLGEERRTNPFVGDAAKRSSRT